MVISFEEFDWHNNSENTKVEEILSSDDLLFFSLFRIWWCCGLPRMMSDV